jgi:hypothetical protein
MDGRFMVDIATYKKMHPGNSMSITPFEENKILTQNEPPKGHFLYLLPPTVFGFNMQEKNWGGFNLLLLAGFMLMLLSNA